MCCSRKSSSASATCPSSHRIIADHAFLRRYHALHPPPLIGILDNQKHFIPAQPPHPSALAARAFTGFDFSCSSFLPSTAGRTWSPIDFFDGRVLLAGVPVRNFVGRHILLGSKVDGKSLVRKFVVCDPVHRRYIMLPAIPVDLNALVHKQELLGQEIFLAPGEDKEDPVKHTYVTLVFSDVWGPAPSSVGRHTYYAPRSIRMNLLLLVFSSLNGQWHVLTSDQWGASATLASFVKSDPELSSRQFVHGCFYWHLQLRNELLVLDLHAMEFSTVNLQSESLGSKSFLLVEAEKGMLGMLTIGNGYDKDIKDRRHWLAYSILTNNQWHLEKVIPLPVKDVRLVRAAGGYLLMYTVHLKSSQGQLEFRYFSVDLKTFQVELFTAVCKHFPGRLYAGFPKPPGRLYSGFPPSLCAPTI
ncbi:unnamed protein product [Triticum turgidum subsp. durum]|uniref:Uncharacterized protein n=1 Tax=Triticum turgidum subsp. durum TaxID=4567 RepID=A0A9R0SR91_TRITD|nr:unnamed protein product [Triticum turgidum subsp. durum]